MGLWGCGGVGVWGCGGVGLWGCGGVGVWGCGLWACHVWGPIVPEHRTAGAGGIAAGVGAAAVGVRRTAAEGVGGVGGTEAEAECAVTGTGRIVAGALLGCTAVGGQGVLVPGRVVRWDGKGAVEGARAVLIFFFLLRTALKHGT